MVENLNKKKEELMQLKSKLDELKVEESQLEADFKDCSKTRLKKHISLFDGAMRFSILLVSPFGTLMFFIAELIIKLIRVCLYVLGTIIGDSWLVKGTEIFLETGENSSLDLLTIFGMAFVTGYEIKTTCYDWRKEARKEWKRIEKNVKFYDKKARKDFKRALYDKHYQKYLNEDESVARFYSDVENYYVYKRGNEAREASNNYLSIKTRLQEIREEITNVKARIQDIGKTLVLDDVLGTNNVQQSVMEIPFSPMELKVEGTSLSAQPADEVEPGGKKPYTKNI